MNRARGLGLKIMQSSRQKKRFSQQKKRHHDHIKAKKGGSGSKEGKTPADPQITTPAMKEKANNPKNSKVEQEDLGSNFDQLQDDLEIDSLQYEENEEHLEQRLIQLLNLPIHHHTPPLPSHTVVVEKTIEPSFLSLDCSTLADTLSSLPLHKKLDISLELLELAEEALLADDGEGYAYQHLATSSLANVDLSRCKKKKETFSFEFRPKDSLQTSDEGDKKEEKEEINSAMNVVPEMTMKHQELSEQMLQQHDSEEDEQLDKLLGDSFKGSGDKEVPSQRSTIAIPSQVPSRTVKQVNNNDTAELDDMLDELLS